jgi:hypothetical protein
MVTKYDNIFLSQALQILPKLGFLVWKQTIWQPWLGIWKTTHNIFFCKKTAYIW